MFQHHLEQWLYHTVVAVYISIEFNKGNQYVIFSFMELLTIIYTNHFI
jgi:hypothetical protein